MTGQDFELFHSSPNEKVAGDRNDFQYLLKLSAQWEKGRGTVQERSMKVIRKETGQNQDLLESVIF